MKNINAKKSLELLRDRATHDEFLFREDTNTDKATKFLDEVDDSCNVIKRMLDAVTILMTKEVDVELLKESLGLTRNNLKYYNSLVKKNRKLTEEEYDLLINWWR